ncbi:retrovirus-related pol polyprotein from transposon TNT 1-94 [Tanacetum coccineum]
MLNIFETMEQKVNEKSPTEILLQNEIDRLLDVSLTSEIRDCVLLSVEQQKHELLRVELEKSSSDSRDIQANLLKRIKILENDFQRSQAQSIIFELKLQHQKEKMACDVSWKAKLSILHDENVLLKHQIESTVKERENITLEFQRLFNSVKATRAQHQNEINEMIKKVNQKTYDYADVRAQNQDLLMTISKLKNKLRTIDKGKHVNTKFDKSETLRQLLCVTPFNKNLETKAKNVSNTKVTTDRPNPVTLQSTSTIEKKQQHNANVNARGMYKINQQDTNIPDSKANTNVSIFIGVDSSNSVKRPKSKDNKSKNSVLKNTKDSSTNVWIIINSVCLDYNKCETKPSNVCQTNACITNYKTINVVNDGLNILCISCGLDVFLHSHDKCVARHALTRKSSVKRALFISPVTAKSKGLGATFVVAKSRFSVAKTTTAINKLLRNFVEKFIRTVRFGNDHFAAITGYGDYVQDNLTIFHVYYVEGLGHNLFSVGQFCDGDLEVYFLRTKDEALDMIIDFVNQVQRNLKASILTIRTEFKNEKLRAFYVKLGIVHKTLIAQTPQQNGVVERRNRTLIEAARTMLIFSNAPEFLWLIRDRKPNVQYFHVFGSLCYPTNNRDDLGKMKPKADIGIFVGYSESSRGFCIYNCRTKKIMETIHVKFDELTAMASECNNLEPGINYTNFNNSSKDSQSVPSISDLDNLFGPMYEEYYVTRSQEVSDNFAANTLDNDHTLSSSSIIVEQDDAPQIVSSFEEQIDIEQNSPVLNEVVDEFIQEDVADFDGNMFHNAPPTPEFHVAESSSTYQDPSNMHQFHQQHRSIDRWTKNHPLEQVIGDPSKSVMTRKRLQTDVEVYMYALTVSTIEPKISRKLCLITAGLNPCKKMS